MPRPTPFHDRLQALCTSYAWKHWSGYYAVCHFHESPEREYNAIRQAAGLLDVTPLFKYDVVGPDAGRFLSYVCSKSVARLKRGRVTYLCWCDDDGNILDDGTCWRLGKESYRVTAAEPSLYWFEEHAEGFDVAITDITDTVAGLALQGPTSRDILRQVCDIDVDALKFFGVKKTTFKGGFKGHVTRTGYTGDLGYELWVRNKHALALWDLLMSEGKAFGIYPIGLDALDICRVESGFVLAGVDYTSAHGALTPAEKSTPFELNLGQTVQLDRGPFIGQRALKAEAERGSEYAFVGLDIDWVATEKVFAEYDLPPSLPAAAWRSLRPVYRGTRQVGRAYSGTWSPILKKNIALATVRADVASPGTVLDIEITAEYERRRVPAVVSALPFFDPPRKRA